jgi:hypothetical protein
MFNGLFLAAGFACGLYFRVVPFIVLMLVSGGSYAAIVGLRGETISTVILDTVIALIAGQLGYFLAVLFRVAKQKRTLAKAAPNTDASNETVVGRSSERSLRR